MTSPRPTLDPTSVHLAANIEQLDRARRELDAEVWKILTDLDDNDGGNAALGCNPFSDGELERYCDEFCLLSDQVAARRGKLNYVWARLITDHILHPDEDYPTWSTGRFHLKHVMAVGPMDQSFFDDNLSQPPVILPREQVEVTDKHTEAVRENQSPQNAPTVQLPACNASSASLLLPTDGDTADPAQPNVISRNLILISTLTFGSISFFFLCYFLSMLM